MGAGERQTDQRGAQKVKDELDRWAEGIAGEKCFDQVLKVYVPTCEKRCLRAVNGLVSKLNRMFLASTVYDARGTWFDEEKGKLLEEPVKVIELGHHCLTKQGAKQLSEALSEYAKKAKQTDVAISQSNFYVMSSRRLKYSGTPVRS